MQSHKREAKAIKMIEIQGKTFGANHQIMLIAEVGTTHLGNIDTAILLIDAAAQAGMDAIKFQLIDPDQLSDSNVEYTTYSNGARKMLNMKEMFIKLSFRKEEWRRIKEYCELKNLIFFATVDYCAGVDLLEEIGVHVHKMGAWDANHRVLFEKIGNTGKPMFMDLGPATNDEIEDMVLWYTGAGGKTMLFMHDFHTANDQEMNMNAIVYLQNKYPQWPVGFSSPAKDEPLDIIAAALGSAYIEKRLILDRTTEAFHAHESLEPEELTKWVQTIRHVERSMGKKEIRPSNIDLEQSREYYRSACTLLPVSKGEMLNENNLGAKRPGTGISAAKLPELWGKRATRDIDVNTLIRDGDYE